MLKGRKTESFCDNWRFSRGDFAGAENALFDDSAWENVTVPHDWSIYGPFSKENTTYAYGGFLPAGIGWYRKTFTIPEDYSDKRTVIEFGGVFRRTRVWINGVEAGFWVNGYVTKCIDISEFLKFGTKNVIAVRVDNSDQPASRYYTGSGIYRDVKLHTSERLYLCDYEPFVKPGILPDGSACISVETKVGNNFSEERDFTLKIMFSDAEGNVVKEMEGSKVRIGSGQTAISESSFIIPDPKLWDTENPYLYTLHVCLVSDRVICDSTDVRVGIRSISFDNKQGFLLNGEKVFLKGVCIHHDNGCLGAVANVSAERRKLEVMKQMGCNAVRLSHNPVSESFLDLCDEMGLVVMDEFFDEWQFPKYILARMKEHSHDRIMIHNYYKDFDNWHETDLRETIRRDRNHPCIIMYSIGNEIPEQRFCILDGERTAAVLKSIVKQEDDTRPVTCACCFEQPGSEDTGFCDLLDVAGYNYAEVLYDSHAERFPERIIVGSENTSIIPFWKRGSYDLSVLNLINRSIDLKVGESLDSIDKRMMSAEYSMREHLSHDGVAGMFIWTGIDYLGEPSPHTWPSRSSYFGATDTCCFPKDGFYFYQSCWSKDPVLHLFPHWNFEGMQGENIDVLAYTNCQSAELFLNGESLGIVRYDRENGEHLHWVVPYKPDTLTAVGYNEKGEKVAKDTVVTAGAPYKIKLSVNAEALNSAKRELCFVTAQVLDDSGNIVPTASNLIRFSVDNGAVMEGVDNGDPEYTGSLKSDRIPALSGKCLAVVAAKAAGPVTIKAVSDGLLSDSITVEFK